MDRPQILDVLADRYTSTAMLNIWSTEAKTIMERRLWLAVLKAQIDLGAIDAPKSVIADYEAVIDQINLDSIRERELVTRHDVKAKIEEFNALAGHQLIHTGMTSRDLTENVEQLQNLKAMEIVHGKVVAVLGRLAHRATEYASQPMAGRSHNVPAQMTTLGKRFANVAEELEQAYDQLIFCMNSYSLRGIKGPVGTQQDILDLLNDPEAVDKLDDIVGGHLGFKRVLTSVGQVYPRSLDFKVVSPLVQIAAVASSFATTLRLMAGQELVTEGFKPGQVGSSAMPHKMNARSSERITGFYNVMRGYLTMIEGPAGNQWNEGDVSCSVVRRVALQGAFLAIDGLLETWLTVLDEFGAYPVVIDREISRYLPFLTTTKLLMAAVKAGMGREEAYEIIKGCAVAAALEMREKYISENPLLTWLGQNPDFPLGAGTIRDVIGDPIDFTGRAQSQVADVVKRIQSLCDTFQEEASYHPEPIL